ncbi:MAG: hypothetical protein MK106_04175 [Mariniblastus sp.]|nr:hypothetical protein [Mariniblastus sp.]
MRIDIQGKSDAQQGAKKPRFDFTSRATKLRLVSLFAALVLVLIAMKEAEKPERWAWLGLSEPPVAKDSPVEQVGVGRHQVSAGGNFSRNLGGSWDGDGKASVSSFRRFWDSSYKKLSLPEKKGLNRLLRQKLSPPPTNHASALELAGVMEKLEALSRDFQTKVLNEISLLPTDAPNKAELNTELLMFREKWNDFQNAVDHVTKKVPLTPSELETLKRIQSTLDLSAYSLVRDGTPVVRSADGPAWLRTWERVQSGATDERVRDEGTLTTHIQMLSQPESYRGRWVEISGSIRGARKVETERNELGIDHYFVLWIQPAETNESPYCVYCLKLPEAISEVGRAFVNMSKPVRVEGIFFKLRSYETTERSMAVCPLVLAESCRLVVAEKRVVREGWQPSAWMWVLFFVFMPLGAAAIATAIYKMTKTSHRTATVVGQKQLSQTLENLSKNPTIRSPAERVKELYHVAMSEDVEAAKRDLKAHDQRGSHDST